MPPMIDDDGNKSDAFLLDSKSHVNNKLCTFFACAAAAAAAAAAGEW